MEENVIGSNVVEQLSAIHIPPPSVFRGSSVQNLPRYSPLTIPYFPLDPYSFRVFSPITIKRVPWNISQLTKRPIYFYQGLRYLELQNGISYRRITGLKMYIRHFFFRAIESDTFRDEFLSQVFRQASN